MRCLFGFYYPVINELTFGSDFRCHGRDSICCCDVIICIPSNLLSYDFWRSTCLSMWREVCITSNFLYYIKNTWSSCFDVIWISTIERPHKTISVWMEIDDKFNFVFMLLKKISNSSSFRLRKGFLTWIELKARIFCLGNYRVFVPINTIVPIQINTFWLIVAISEFSVSTNFIWVHVLTFVKNRFHRRISFMMVLN